MPGRRRGRGGGGSRFMQIAIGWVVLLGLCLLAAHMYYAPTALHLGAPAAPVAVRLVGGRSAASSLTAVDDAGGLSGSAPSKLVAVGDVGGRSAPESAAPVDPSLEPDIFQDNCPRPPPKEGDRDFASEVWAPLPNADANHLHGQLSAVSGYEPTPLPPGGLRTKEEKWEAHKGQCFNAAVSDSLPLDRNQPDKRSSACKALHAGYYSKGTLPNASVVIVFHNEIFSALLRSVHSVLSHTPPELLVEIILVDDASTPDPSRFSKERWQRLQEPLEEHLRQLPKLRLARLKQRRGLMLARMEGAWRAAGEVVIFLDSHIEATAGWAEPLLARIRDDPKRVVVPNIGSLHFDSLAYQGSSGLGVLEFTWSLGQNPMPLNNRDSTEPSASPIMAGGLFASHRRYFMHLGGYDPLMRFYGGEEMEIGFRTWQCGGRIEYIPCSHVYHIFRESEFWQGTDSGGVAYKVPGMEITRNKLRTAAVWMDEYAKLVEYASAPLTKEAPMGDLAGRIALRAKLHCKPFKWYMETVVPNMFVPKIENLRAGALRNAELNGCIDTMGGEWPGLYPCHGQHGSQAFVMDGKGLIRVPAQMYTQCVTLRQDHHRLHITSCPEGDNLQRKKSFLWRYDNATGIMSNGALCLKALKKETGSSPLDVDAVSCASQEPGAPSMRWEWQNA